MLRKILGKNEGRMSAVDIKHFILNSLSKHEIPFKETSPQYENFLKIKMETYNFWLVPQHVAIHLVIF